jgi:hypothetical protein
MYFAFSASNTVAASAIVACPSGQRAFGGGGVTTNFLARVVGQGPLTAGGTQFVLTQGQVPDGWFATKGPSASATPVFAYVICGAP